MAFMALILGMVGLVIFITGIILCIIGIIFWILFIIKRRKYKGQNKKIKVVFLVLAIIFTIIGLPGAVGVPIFVSTAQNLAIDSSVSPKNYPVINAIDKHDNGKLESLLKSGTNPNEIYQGVPALFWASSNFDNGVDINAVKILINYKANMHVKTDDGETLMQYILTGTVRDKDQTNTYNIVKYLIDNGYDVNETDSGGATLLMYATVNSSSCPSNTIGSNLVTLFISKGVNVNAKDKLGRTALMWECGYNEADGFDNTDDTKPSINAKRELGAPYLPCRVSDIKALISAGADVNDKNINGFTALDYFQAVEKYTTGFGDYDPAHNGPDPTIFKNYTSDCLAIEKLLSTKQ